MRTETEEPSPEAVRTAVRDVITHCIYGVDKNPLAVDLCKVALWIEGHGENKPLTFLDHRIRCGDSLVGVLDMKVLEDGIPDGAYKPVTGDVKSVAKELKQKNKKEREGARALPFGAEQEEAEMSRLLQPILELSDDTPEEVRRKRKAFEKIHSKGTKLWYEEAACNLWTGVLFCTLTDEARQARHIPTTDDLWSFMENESSVDSRLPAHAWQLKSEYSFFHWPLEFPDVFENGGFDVVLCNPPWEILQLEEREYFSSRDSRIALAHNKTDRSKLIGELREYNPILWREYQEASHNVDALRRYLRGSTDYPLTAKGRINSYAVFAERIRLLINDYGLAGILVPTGIATDKSTAAFFTDLIDNQAISQLIGFENEALLFPAVGHTFKFCALTMTGKQRKASYTDFAFWCRYIEDVRQEERHFQLSKQDLALISPNTNSCPIFRTKRDSFLTQTIYEHVPVLINEKEDNNPWNLSFRQGLFNMSTDFKYFKSREELASHIATPIGNCYEKGKQLWLPLYEAKMFWKYDHRYSSYSKNNKLENMRILPQLSIEQKQNPLFMVQPQYWVLSDIVVQRFPAFWKRKWFLCFRDITRAGVEHTAIFSIVPL